jgi:hypothetical protein
LVYMKFLNSILPFINIIDPRRELHAGLCVDVDNRYYYVLVSRKQGDPARIILKKSDLSSTLKIPFNGPVHTDLGIAPVMLVRENIGDTDPDQWVDQNESRIIPSGVTGKEIINEWCVEDHTIYSATVSKKVFEKALGDLHSEKLLFSSLSAPLWDLARLYSNHISGPFIIWKLSANGSLLGLVDSGRLTKLCNFWPGADDIANNGEETGKALASLVKSLSPDNLSIPILIRGCKKDFSIPEQLKNSGCAFAQPLQIKDVPWEYHEAYAMALHEETNLDFASYEHTKDAHDLLRNRKRALTVSFACVASLIVLVALLFIVKAGSFGAGLYLTNRAMPMRSHMEMLKKENTRLKTLSGVMAQKTRFFSQRSALTHPVTELQTAFPEGVWAEDISFSEGNSGIWGCTIVAYANSSGLIPSFLKNLASIPSMSDVRMVYSEQTGISHVKAGEKAIRLQVQGNYR